MKPISIGRNRRIEHYADWSSRVPLFECIAKVTVRKETSNEIMGVLNSYPILGKLIVKGKR